MFRRLGRQNWIELQTRVLICQSPLDWSDCQWTHPGLHVSEDVLQLGESDLGGGHELLHDREVPVPCGEGLPSVELHLPPTFLHAGPQLSHVLLKFFHAEIGNIALQGKSSVVT